MEDESTKASLLRAATDLLAIGGPEAVTLRAVGARVGVSHNAPYRHFQDKNALLAAVARAGFTRLTMLIDDATSSASSPVECLLAMVPAYIAFARENPRLYHLLFDDRALVEQDSGNIEAKAKSLFSLVEQVVEAALPNESQHFTRLFTTAIYSASHGVMSLEMSGRLRFTNTQSTAEEMVSMLINRLIAPVLQDRSKEA